MTGCWGGWWREWMRRGRGAFAGPLLAAAVLLDYERLGEAQIAALAAVNDSKQLSAARRAALYPHILAAATAVAISVRGPQRIDLLGLHPMNLEANATALAQVSRPGAILLADGFALPAIADVVPRKIIHGDATSAAIACASIIAKVCRDRLMGAPGRPLPRLRVRPQCRLRNSFPSAGDSRTGPQPAAPPLV